MWHERIEKFVLKTQGNMYLIKLGNGCEEPLNGVRGNDAVSCHFGKKASALEYERVFLKKQQTTTKVSMSH